MTAEKKKRNVTRKVPCPHPTAPCERMFATVNAAKGHVPYCKGKGSGGGAPGSTSKPADAPSSGDKPRHPPEPQRSEWGPLG